MTAREEFEKFISANLDSAYRFAFILTQKREDAEDVVNESVIRALNGIGKLRNRQYMKTWFYRIIINTSASYIKKNRRAVLSERDITEAIYDDYSVLTIESLTHMLDEKHRNIVVLRFCEDMPIKDIAEILCENENTVKTRLYKALKILKREVLKQ